MKEASRPMIAYECQDIFDFDEASLNMDSKRMQCKNDLPFSVDMSVKKIDADNATSNGNICEGPMLDANGEISFNSGSNNKRQRKNNLPSDVDMSCKQIFDDNVASAERRSIPVHRSNKVDVEEKEKTTYMGDQGNFLKQAIDSVDEKKHCSSECLFKKTPFEENTPVQKNTDDASQFDDSSQQNYPSPNICTYPDSEFHNFEECRSCKNVEDGQIWALYSDLDKFPNFYAWENKVELEPFKVHLTWLEACPEQEQEKQWLEQEIAISCGIFKVRKWRITYDSVDAFSHLVHARQGSTKWQFEIYPQVGEVWVIYVNWSPVWAPSNNHGCPEYAIGEIKRCTRDGTTFAFLSKVDGYVAVFKPDKRKAMMKIPTKENLRFSHRIPPFRLTKEDGGKLRGFFELDPAAVPAAFLQQGSSK